MEISKTFSITSKANIQDTLPIKMIRSWRGGGGGFFGSQGGGGGGGGGDDDDVGDDDDHDINDEGI